MSSGAMFGRTNREETGPVELVENEVVGVFHARSHVLFLKSDGTLWGSGSNKYGQLGNGWWNRKNWVAPVHLDLQAYPSADTHNYYFDIEGDQLKLARTIRHLKRKVFHLHLLGITEAGQRVEKRCTIEVGEK